MKRIVTLLGIAAVVLSTESIAQAPVKVLSFQDAVKIAIQNSIALNQTKNTLDQAQAQRTQSVVAMAPSVAVFGQAIRVDGNSFNPNTGTVVNGVRDNVTASINANLNLFSGFNRQYQIKQYANALEAQSYFVNRTTQDVVNTVALQYLTVMLDAQLLKIAQQNFIALDKQLTQVRESVVLGARSAVDEYNQDALTKAAQLRMTQAEITLNNDRSLLTQTLLIDPFEVYDVEKPAWDLSKLGYDSLNIEELVEQAKIYRGDYLRAVKLEAASRYAMKAQKAFMVPTLTAVGSYSSAYNFQHNVPDSISDGNGGMISNPSKPRPFSEQFKTNNVQKQYGLQLNIPVFNGLQTRTNAKILETTYKNNELNKKNLEYQIKNDVIRAVRTFEGAKIAYHISVDQVTAADAAFQLETERYNLGVTNFVDFTNANRALIQAQTDEAQNEYRLVFQRILVEYAVGSLKPELLE